MKSASITSTAGEDGSLAATASQGWDETKQVDLPLGSWPIIIPGTPIELNANLDLVVGAKASFEVGVTTAVTEHADFTIGASYADGHFKPIVKPGFTAGCAPPTLYGTADLKAYMGPQLSTTLYDVAGPDVGVDGYGEFTADTTATPWWTLHGGLEGSIGFKMQVLSHTVADWSYTHDFYDHVFAQAPAGSTPPPGPTPTPPTSGLVGHWKFDNSKNLGLDSSGLGNNGTPAPSYVTYSADGKVGGAAQFTAGSDAGITIPDAPSLDFTSGVTVSAWVKMDAADGYETILSKSGTDTNEPYVLWASFWATNDDLAAFFDGASASDDSGVSVASGSWQFVAMTYDGTPGGTICFYVNGVLVASQLSNAIGMASNTSALHIGASPCPGPEDFSGLIDEVRLYDRALSSTEISDIYDNG